MLRQRVVSALAVMPPILALAWYGGWPFLAMVVLAAHLALRELYNLMGQKDRLQINLGYAGNLILLLYLFRYGFTDYVFALVGYFILLNCLFVVTYPRDFMSILVTAFGKLYITTLLGFILLLRAHGGFAAVLAVFLAVWANDSGAYFCGVAFGRHRLAPRLSPKKSVEGAVGGLLTAMLVLYLFAPVLGWSRPVALVFGLILALAGQFGDLAESALKRWANTKDSGSFLPGHGGVLDRVDSLLFAVPVAFLIMYYFAF